MEVVRSKTLTWVMLAVLCGCAPDDQGSVARELSGGPGLFPDAQPAPTYPDAQPAPHYPDAQPAPDASFSLDARPAPIYDASFSLDARPIDRDAGLTPDASNAPAPCDAVRQDDCNDGEACYVHLFDGRPDCWPIPADTADRTQNKRCLTDAAGVCRVDGCAAGYLGILAPAVPGRPPRCASYCRPVNTFRIDPDGNGIGPLVNGADADGAAPDDCSEAATGLRGLQCRFVQSVPYEVPGANVDAVAPDVGFCAPRLKYGDCSRYSQEHLYLIYDQAAATGADPQAAVDQYCADHPLRCAVGCTDLATHTAIRDAYCANRPGSASCLNR